MTSISPQQDNPVSAIMLESAVSITVRTGAQALFVHCDLDDDVTSLEPGLGESYKTVLVTQKNAIPSLPRAKDRYVVRLPDVPLTRMGLVKMATVVSFSQGVLQAGERFVFLTGAVGGGLDTILRMTVGTEFELLQTVGQPVLTEHIRRAVFQKVLNQRRQNAHGITVPVIGGFEVTTKANPAAVASEL